jgi:hypothetical protein
MLAVPPKMCIFQTTLGSIETNEAKFKLTFLLQKYLDGKRESQTTFRRNAKYIFCPGIITQCQENLGIIIILFSAAIPLPHTI